MVEAMTRLEQEGEELKFVNHQLQGMQEEREAQNSQAEEDRLKYQALLKEHEAMGAELTALKEEKLSSSG